MKTSLHLGLNRARIPYLSHRSHPGTNENLFPRSAGRSRFIVRDFNYRLYV
jgi:hypothetical protein